MRYLVLIHRWFGVALCVLFCAWFISGIVMIYQPFPSFSKDKRIQHSEVISSKITLEPVHKILQAKKASPSSVTLISILGEPYYSWQDEHQNGITTVHAISGEPGNFNADQIHKIARGIYPEKPIQTVQPPVDYDQWIVSNRFDPYRPFYRVDFGDPSKTSIYISSRTAQILQQTTQSQRRWNYVGAVVHWIYPTMLRKHWVVWDQVVWWLALIGIISAITGLVLGSIRTLQTKIGWTKFEGWLKWHHLTGLLMGVVVLSWIFSGWLSMDHGRLFSKPDPSSEQLQAFYQLPLNAISKDLPALDTIVTSSKLKELELRVIAGVPYAIATSYAGGYQTWALDAQHLWRKQKSGLPRELLHDAITAAWPHASIAEFSLLENDNVYTNLREGKMASSVYRVVLTDSNNTWIYVDSLSGKIISVMDSGRRLYRWLYNGLHSLDFPVLTSRPLLWYSVILTLLGIGVLFSATGVVLGIRRLMG